MSDSSNMPGNNKALGLEPPKYVKVAYILLLIAAGVGLLTSLLAMIGVFTGLGAIANLLGIAGVVMGILGWAVFKDKFSALEMNHLQYIVILFLAFFVVGIVVGAMMLMSPMGTYAAMLLLGIAQFGLIFTGYNSWTHGRMITKDNIQGEVKAAMNRS